MVYDEEMKKTPAGRLVAARKRIFGADSSASEAAIKLGIAKGTYLGLENGSRSITAKMAEKLSRRLSITPEFLLFGRGKEVPLRANNVGTRIAIYLTTAKSAFTLLASGEYPDSERMITISAPGAAPEKRLYIQEVADRSMSRDTYPSYPAGVSILFLPVANLSDCTEGEIVHVWVEDLGDSVIRQLIKMRKPGAGVVWKLRAFNSDFEDIELCPELGDFPVGRYAGQIAIPL